MGRLDNGLNSNNAYLYIDVPSNQDTKQNIYNHIVFNIIMGIVCTV